MKKYLETIRPWQEKETLFIKYRDRVYNLYEMPYDFILEAHLDLSGFELEYLPDLSDVIIIGDFDCSDNNLCSLYGAPRLYVGGSFNCAMSQNILVLILIAVKMSCPV